MCRQSRSAPDETSQGGIGDRATIEIKVEMMRLDEDGRKAANTMSSLVERTENITGPVTSETKTRNKDVREESSQEKSVFHSRRDALIYSHFD